MSGDDSLTIRAASLRDAEALAPLALMAMAGMLDYLYAGVVPGLRTVEIVARQLADVRHPLGYPSCTVAELGGHVVGFARAHAFDADIPAPDLPIPEHRFEVIAPAQAMAAPGSHYIDSLAVAEAFRGKGIGTRLVNKVFADARRNGHASVSLHVFEENRDAVRLYEANGFTVVDRMPGLRREPMLYAGDLLLMQADVPGTRR